MKNNASSEVEEMWESLLNFTCLETEASELAYMCDKANPNNKKQSCFKTAMAKKKYEKLYNKPLSRIASGLLIVSLLIISFCFLLGTGGRMFKGEPFVVILCLIGITTFGIYLTRRMRKENLLRDKIDHDTVVFFERAAEIYLVLFKHFDQTTTFDLCSAIERLVSDLTDTIKMSPNLRDPSEPDQDPVAEERLLLKTAVDLVVHLELMGTNKINALLSNKNDCEALKKYRAEMLYKKLFETA